MAFGKKNVIKIDPLSYNIGLIGESGIGKTTIIKEMCEKLAGRLQGSNASDYATTAVLTKTAAQAEELYFALKDRLPVTLLTSESNRMEQGIVITTFYLAKGL